jgi:hypothetical protein
MKKYFKLIIKKFALLGIVCFLSNCGGGSGGSTTATGLFLDSAVEGIKYDSGSITGLTDTNGTFQYEIGGNVRFMIGDIFIGEASGGSVVTPVDFVSGSDPSHPTVLNIVAFLLTLDDDNNPDNGIQISETIRNLAKDSSINFAQTTTTFTADGNVQVVVSQLTAATSAGARSLVSSAFAESHLRNTLSVLNAGSGGGYSLTITGDSQVPGSITLKKVFGGSTINDELLVVTWMSELINNDIWGLSFGMLRGSGGGTSITFGNPLGYECLSGLYGSYGDCSGATFDHNTRTATFSNVELQAPGFGNVITVNGTLAY